MYLRAIRRKKNGKVHRYYSVVESRRLPIGKIVQRPVLYLGEINDSQQSAWRKTLEVFDEQRGEVRQLCLFPEDRPIPADAADAIHVRLTEMILRRPRAFGDCWLGCEIWRMLELDRFWQSRLEDKRGEVPWAKVLQLLAVNRLIDPGSEFRLHRQWFVRTAMDQLLDVDESACGKDRLYRCLDRVLTHKDELFQHLQQRWKDLFAADFDVLLYDLTSTYFEGLCRQNPKAKHGYSRDGRSDCRQVVIALIVTPRGLPLAYEVMPGNTSDRTTLKVFLAKIEAMYGKARRRWLMDRGIPTEADLKAMREEGIDYLVGTPKGQLTKLEALLADLPWQQVRDHVEVKLLEKEGEVWVLARSQDRRQKEHSMRRRRLRDLFGGLRHLQRRAVSRDRLISAVAVLRHEAGRAASLVEIDLPDADQPVTKETFRFRLRVEAFQAAQARDGSYLLRGTAGGQDPAALWEQYMLLTEIEAAFKCLKSDLAIRPVYHQLEHRVDAHILVAFLGYCLSTTLKQLLLPDAPGLTPKAVLEKLATILMVDVWLPVAGPDADDGPGTTSPRWLVMPRYTHPDDDQRIVLGLLGMTLPPQPPPRITARQIPTQLPLPLPPTDGPNPGSNRDEDTASCSEDL